jgi:hypothetical protein
MKVAVDENAWNLLLDCSVEPLYLGIAFGNVSWRDRLLNPLRLALGSHEITDNVFPSIRSQELLQGLHTASPLRPELQQAYFWPPTSQSSIRQCTVLLNDNPRIIKVKRPMRGSKKMFFVGGFDFGGFVIKFRTGWGVACGVQKNIGSPVGGFDSVPARVKPDIPRLFKWLCICVQCVMTQDDSYRPRPSGLRSFFKPIILDQAGSPWIRGLDRAWMERYVPNKG